MKTIIITGADAKYFGFSQGTILSIRDQPQGKDMAIAYLDLGCTDEQLHWLRQRVDFIKKPEWHFDFPTRAAMPEYLKGLLVRPFLREYFPGFDVYLWIDADAWVQDWMAVDLFVQGAGQRKGLAIVPEIHRASMQQYGKLPQFSQWIAHQYALIFNEEIGKQLCTYPLLNAGVFALHSNAAHWEVWEKLLAQGLQKNASIMTDQFVLNYAIYCQNLFGQTEMLPVWCNWIFNGSPAWDADKQILVEPYLPNTPIGILHLAGHKRDRMDLQTIQGEKINIPLTYLDLKQQLGKSHHSLKSISSWDYISAEMQKINLDAHFPHKIVGNKDACGWQYLRREIPHNWYVDQRHPYIGFLSPDEAHILYNNALKFKGKRALEIGCWMGWSACHLAAAGVHLDVVDPIIGNEAVRNSIMQSLQSTGNTLQTFGEIILIAGYSPQKVEEFASEKNRKWSLIFIDGNHDAPFPRNDAIACEKYAEADAMILFHDLASPEVSQGLDYLRDQGWHTMIYQTMQIMGVAWRGNVEPVQHIPDPEVDWVLPSHLHDYEVSSLATVLPSQEFREILSIIRPYTLLSDARLFSLYALAKQVCDRDLPGNFVECGVCKGGASALIAFVVKKYSKRSRQVFAFDTFAGMPDPTEIDRHQGIPANDTGAGVGTLVAPMQDCLLKVCELMSVSDIVIPVQGLFADTLPKYTQQIGQIALLHADGDWYQSTMDIFNNLYDLVIHDGIIQVDDYGHWEGCRQAIDDFAEARKETFNIKKIDYTGVWFTRPYRGWNSSIPTKPLKSIHAGCFKYSWKGISMLKNPFDYALYPLLLWNIKPRTIIEVGSFGGGSAVWLADTLHTFEIDCHIYSVDINKVNNISHPDVTFLEGDQRNLENVFTPEFMNNIPRPLLVIEDASHIYDYTLTTLNFFHPYLRKDEYMVVEDGIITDLGEDDLFGFKGGPGKAIKEFLNIYPEHYQIDTRYCDFFGHNFTWNPNGYLRKIA